MKLAKVAKLCKRYNHVEILNEQVITPAGVDNWTQEEVEKGLVQLAGTQWIGDGDAFYKMSGMPQIITAAQWLRQYDVPERKRDQYFFAQNKLKTWMNWDDYAAGEQTADIRGTTIGCDGLVPQGVYAADGPEVQLVDTAYLEPLDDLMRAEIVIRRDETGKAYIGVRQEMELVAVIRPIVFGATAGCINTETELELLLSAISQQISASRLRQESMREGNANAE